MESKNFSINHKLTCANREFSGLQEHRNIKAVKPKVCLAQDPISRNGQWWTSRGQQKTEVESYLPKYSLCFQLRTFEM